jgi:exosortase family protein XrtF
MPFLNLNNRIARFFVLATILYISWYAFYELVIKPHTALDARVITLIIDQAAFLLNLFGFTTYRAVEEDNMQLLGIDGAHPIWIGAPCNAVTLFAFFALFIIAFPGPGKHKLWFIPIGMMIIHIANLLRVMALTIISFYKPEYLAFNHTYTFTVLVYAIIFGLWMWWVNFSLKKMRHESKA